MLLACLYTSSAFAQFPFEEPSISLPLDPKPRISPCEEYTPLGSTVNFWDWRQQEYIVHFRPGQGAPRREIIDSPFYASGNTTHPNTFFLLGSSLSPADGWELLYRDFGTSDKPVGEPSFGLYNRKTGMVRVFFWIEPNGESPYQTAIVSALHAVENPIIFGGEAVRSAIFEHLNIPVNPLDNFDKSGLSFGQINKIVINGTWHVLEFIAAYDPCVCEATSFLNFEPTLHNVSSQTFTIEGTSISEAIYSQNSSTGGSHLGNALNYANSAIGTFQSGVKIYKDLDDFFDDSDLFKGIKESGIAEEFFESVADFLPGGGLGLKLLGFFVGKGGGSQPPTLAGFNHDFRFEGAGTIETLAPYEPKTIFTPGSFYQPNPAVANLRPVYDNPLGVMNVLKRPKVEKAVSLVNPQCNFATYRYVGPLEYVVNEFAELGVPIRLEGALVWTDCSTDDGFFATPSIGLGCFSGYHVPVQNTYLNFCAGVLPLPGGELSPMQELAAVAPNCNGEPSFQVTAFFNGDVIFSARYKVEIVTAPYSFDNTPGIAITTKSEISDACLPSNFDLPIEDGKITEFCSSVYDPTVKRDLIQDVDLTDVFQIDEKDFDGNEGGIANIYPNPFKDYLSVRIDAALDGELGMFQLMDANSRVVWQVRQVLSAGEMVFTTGVSQLQAGSYFLRVITDSEARVFPLLKQ